MVSVGIMLLFLLNTPKPLIDVDVDWKRLKSRVKYVLVFFISSKDTEIGMLTGHVTRRYLGPLVSRERILLYYIIYRMFICLLE